MFLLGAIIFDSMNQQKLDKLRKRLEELRKKGGIGSAELESLARALGRVPFKRGKEPTWVNKIFSDLRPLSIPRSWLQGSEQDYGKQSSRRIIIRY